MGQANSRGTHAERVAQAIERDSAERKRKDETERAASCAERERVAPAGSNPALSATYENRLFL